MCVCRFDAFSTYNERAKIKHQVMISKKLVHNYLHNVLVPIVTQIESVLSRYDVHRGMRRKLLVAFIERICQPELCSRSHSHKLASTECAFVVLTPSQPITKEQRSNIKS